MGAGVGFGALDRWLDLGAATRGDIANRSSIWLLGAFASGAVFRSRWAAAVAGTAFLVAALCGFYGYMHFVEGQADSSYLGSVAVIWLVGAVVAGPLLGLLGAEWRREKRWPPLGVAALFVLEAAGWPLVGTVHPERIAVSAGEVVAAVGVSMLAFRPRAAQA